MKQIDKKINIQFSLKVLNNDFTKIDKTILVMLRWLNIDCKTEKELKRKLSSIGLWKFEELKLLFSGLGYDSKCEKYMYDVDYWYTGEISDWHDEIIEEAEKRYLTRDRRKDRVRK